MRVLLALFAAVALAQKDKAKKKKAAVRCFGKEDDDHFTCMKLDKEACAENSACDFGTDRVEKKKVDMENCMTKQKAKIGALCDKAGETSSCKCGTMCHHIGWMNKNVCYSCYDAGIKEDCDKSPASLSCKWIGTEEDGKCIEGTNECSSLGKKECAKAAGKCKYLKKAKKCQKAYKDSCYGLKEDTHNLCYDVETKEACMEVTAGVFKKQMCAWGYNKLEREDKNKKCMEDVGQDIGKTCSSQSDCKCGTTCLEIDFGFAKMKSCSICKDMGVKADCETAAAAGMGCKWVGKNDETGVCLKKDMCKEASFEKAKCEAMELCEYDTDTDMCGMQEVTSKTCKAIGKRKKGEPKDEKSKKEAGIKCNMIPECQFNDDKGKCSFRKQK